MLFLTLSSGRILIQEESILNILRVLLSTSKTSHRYQDACLCSDTP